MYRNPSQIHWADVSSLDLLASLICRTATRSSTRVAASNGVVFAAAYRPDEVSHGAAFGAMLGQLGTAGDVSVSSVELGGLSLGSINKMVSDALCLPVRRTRSLSRVIYQKTEGVSFVPCDSFSFPPAAAGHFLCGNVFVTAVLVLDIMLIFTRSLVPALRPRIPRLALG